MSSAERALATLPCRAMVSTVWKSVQLSWGRGSDMLAVSPGFAADTGLIFIFEH